MGTKLLCLHKAEKLEAKASVKVKGQMFEAFEQSQSPTGLQQKATKYAEVYVCVSEIRRLMWTISCRSGSAFNHF